MKKFTKLEWLELCVKEEKARLKQMEDISNAAFADEPKKKTKTKSKVAKKIKSKKKKIVEVDNSEFWPIDDDPEFWDEVEG